MKDLASNYRNLAVETILAAAVSVCIGMLAYGLDVFNIYNHKFVFVAEGLTGAFTFYALRRLRPRDAVVFILVAFFFQVGLLTRSTGLLRILVEFLFFVSIPLASAVLFLELPQASERSQAL